MAVVTLHLGIIKWMTFASSSESLSRAERRSSATDSDISQHISISRPSLTNLIKLERIIPVKMLILNGINSLETSSSREFVQGTVGSR